MNAFTKNKEMLDAFSKFRGVCQFIMHIHKKYHVKLNDNLDSELLLDTISNVLGKYVIRYPIL